MKYALQYYRGCEILDQVDEIIINYYEKDKELINFLNKILSYQRLIIDISTLENIDENIEIFKQAFEKNNNIAIKCSKNQNFNILKENNLSFFFKEGANTWDKLVGYIEAGVSDIYIVDELGFSLRKIKNAYKDCNINIRVYPNIAQSSSDLYKNTFKKFFIRPEDLYLYENIIDVIEFADIRLKAQPTYLKVYKEGVWNDNLNIIIAGLDIDINTMAMIPLFAESRLNCGKRCALNNCHICDHIQIIAGDLEDNKIFFKTTVTEK